MTKSEFCIMPNGSYWKNYRYDGRCHRHEIFYGTSKNRQYSIEDGLVVFLAPEMHNMSNLGIHFNREADQALKQMAERVWIEHYGRTIQEFVDRYGKNYIEEEWSHG